MSFDFGDLFDTDEDYNYDNFLSDPIYDWLNLPEEVLETCNNYKNDKKRKTCTIIQQPETMNKKCKPKLYRRGPYRKKKKTVLNPIQEVEES